MFRPIVYLKTNVVVKILLEHCFLMLSAVIYQLNNPLAIPYR